MKLNFHNKIEVVSNKKTLVFFNSMLPSIFSAIQNQEKFTNCLAIGTGAPSENQNVFKLSTHLKTCKLQTELIQNDISKGICYIKKSIVLSDYFDLIGKHVTEIGFTHEISNEPTIVNYISLISEDTPNGVYVSKTDPVLIYVYLYLNINSNNNFVLTAGKNPFVSFLLGEGLSGNFYATRGNCLIDNSLMERHASDFLTKFECFVNFEFIADNNLLNLTIQSNLNVGKTYEIVFLIENEPFARLQMLNIKPQTLQSINFSPKESFVIDLGEDVSHVEKIVNNSTNQEESNTYFKNYATSFGDKITLPFNLMFNADTPRFVSKEGDKIYFVIDDQVYGYVNENYQLHSLNTSNIQVQQITKIVSFENFVFVFSDTEPFVSAFCYNNDNFDKIEIQSLTELKTTLSSALFVDAVCSKSNTFMIAAIDFENNFGHTFYFNFDESTNTFTYISKLVAEYQFSYLLAMHKNNFSDARIMFLKEGEYSNQCKIVTHFPDATVEDIYTVLGYFYTKDTKEVYVKSRAVITEKTTSPRIMLFYYPQMYQYKLPLISDEDDDYFSTNLLYLIQKRGSSFEIYNLVGYNTPQKFKNGFSNFLKQESIVDFEFLNDTLLIFTNNESEPVIGLNLQETSGLIENVSDNMVTYNVSMSNYNILGNNNEGVIATFHATISIWYFQIKSVNLFQERIQLFLQLTAIKWIFLFLMMK